MIQVLDSKDELDRFSGVRTSELVVAHIASDLEEEEEEIISLERKKGLPKLLAGRAKGSTPKDTSRSQLPPALPSPHPPLVNPFTPANLKKRKNDEEVVEERELVPHNEEVPPKLLRTAKNKGRASSIESREERHMAELSPQNPAWNPQLELDRVAIPWNSTIKEFQ